jgi:gluconokinase
MIPFLGGERSTGFRGGARACISGLTRDTTSNDVMYACLESVVLRLGRVLELISEACASRRTEGADESPENILVASGAALERNALWRRMLADCSNADVIVDGDSAEEGTSRGVAILLAESLQQTGLGAHHATFGGIVEQPLVVADETKCNAVARERWMTAASSQESLIAAIAPTW